MGDGSTRKWFLSVVLVVALAGVVSFLIVRAATGGSPPVPETSLTEEERHSIHATAVAETGDLMRADRIEFARSGASLDSLPRSLIQSIDGIQTRDPAVALADADKVVLVQSEGAYVDEASGQLRLRARVLEAIKGSEVDSIDIPLNGGPRRDGAGGWVLALAPHELYLEKGEVAILFLTGKYTPDGALRQRSFEAMLVSDGKVISRPYYAFSGTHTDIAVDEVRDELMRAAE